MANRGALQTDTSAEWIAAALGWMLLRRWLAALWSRPVARLRRALHFALLLHLHGTLLLHLLFTRALLFLHLRLPLLLRRAVVDLLWCAFDRPHHGQPARCRCVPLRLLGGP